jgi:uncharacterized membrane protein
MESEKVLNVILRVIVTMLLMMIMWALTLPAQAETTYYILGDRSVVRTYTSDPGFGEDKIVYVDCEKLRSQDDVIGCIIAANYEREQQLEKAAAKKKTMSEKTLAKH